MTLQGYIEDLHAETTESLLNKAVKDTQVLIEEAKSKFSNPHDLRIEQLFCSLGLPNILDGLKWQKASNRTIRKRLTDYIKIRNRIAHGSQESISKAKVEQIKKFVLLFAEKFDAKVGDVIKTVTRKQPWC